MVARALHGTVEGVADGVEVVPVEDPGSPPEGLELGFQGIQGHLVLGVPIHRQPVSVDDQKQASQPEPGSREDGFPGTSLVALSVGDEAPGASIDSVQSLAQCHTDGEAQAVAQ